MLNKPIVLFGNKEENFYKLGQKDKTSALSYYQECDQVLSQYTPIQKVLKKGFEISTAHLPLLDKYQFKELRAYAEGLEKDLFEVLFYLLLPELSVPLNSLAPQISGLIPGCSTLFYKNTMDQNNYHLRVLDRASNHIFNQNQRAVQYQFSNCHEVYSIGTAGIPYPLYTAINQHGLSFSLHHKYSDFFDIKGTPIFKIIEDLLYQAHTINDVIKLIKKQHSMTLWNLNFADKNGDIVSIDITGKDIYHEKYSLNDHAYLYFNNLPLKESRDEATHAPHGNSSQCMMRNKFIQGQLKSFKFDQKNIELKMMQKLASFNINKKTSAQKWILPILNPASAQYISMNNQQCNITAITSKTPKLYRGEVQTLYDLFNQKEFKNKKITPKYNPEYLQAFEAISEFQNALINNQISTAYHKIQMALPYLKGTDYYYIVYFYFLIMQYIYEFDDRDLISLIEPLESLEGKLPEYLEDNRIAFLYRLSIISGLPHKISLAKIKNKLVKKQLVKEKSFHPLKLKQLKRFIEPRIDILDILIFY